jgi:hypothetical protein
MYTSGRQQASAGVAYLERELRFGWGGTEAVGGCGVGAVAEGPVLSSTPM